MTGVQTCALPTWLKKAIAFKPATSLRDGIGRTLEYFERLYRENPAALDQIKVKNWER